MSSSQQAQTAARAAVCLGPHLFFLSSLFVCLFPFFDSFCQAASSSSFLPESFKKTVHLYSLSLSAAILSAGSLLSNFFSISRRLSPKSAPKTHRKEAAFGQ